MQTSIPHENHVDGFFLTHAQSPTFRAILIPPFFSHGKDDITEFHNYFKYYTDASKNVSHSVTEKGPNTFQIKAFGDPKSNKIDKRAGYSDHLQTQKQLRDSKQKW